MRYRHSGWNEGSIFLHKLSSKGCRLYNSYDCAFAALFLTVLIFVIQTSSNMSKQIVDITKNNLDYKLEVKPTLRKFLIYGLIIIAFSGVCALIETLLKSVVTI